MSLDINHEANVDRCVKTALKRGWCGRCPNCGEGRILYKYLKVVDKCTVCDEDFHHQRADDGPAYLTILVVAHIVGVALHMTFSYSNPEPLVLFAILSVVAIGSSLILLPRFKGSLVGLQWAKRMHGFGKKQNA
ncbi:MAG: DUF983 domain-containing protein [Halocynthiibacter sp.]